MENKVERKSILYLVVTNLCNLNCSFCFNKFVDEFKNKNNKILKEELATKTIQSINPDIINFIGGEPLLYPNVMNEIINKNQDRKRMWCISSNLFFKDIKSRIPVLKNIQDFSTDIVSIGTSFNYDRFANKEEYYSLWKDNINILQNNGIKVGVTITLTKDHITNIKPEELLDIMKNKLKVSSVNIERCIYGEDVTDQELYNSMDEYMKECFSLFPKEMNYQWNRFYNSVLFRVPVFDKSCSEVVKTLYPNGDLNSGCPLNSGKDTLFNFVKKIVELKCNICEYYPYCRGDCECSRHIVCTFPKRTLQYIKDIIKEEYKNK